MNVEQTEWYKEHNVQRTPSIEWYKFLILKIKKIKLKI